MLAPLKDRSILSRTDGDEGPAGETEKALRLALQQARQTQRRAALEGARRSVALSNEVACLTERNRQLQRRLDELESGQTITALGQQLMALRAENDALLAAAHRLCHLSQALNAVRRECEHLARARDRAPEHFLDSPPRHTNS